jgi:hypothetical protein
MPTLQHVPQLQICLPARSSRAKRTSPNLGKSQ